MSPDAYSAHTIVYTALVNPVAGRGSAARVWRGVHRLLREAGVPVCVATTRSQEHAIELAASAAQRSQVVIAVGGDGLVRDAASGVVRYGGRVAIVPAGRGNDLARTLGIPQRPMDQARMLLAGRTRSLDLLRVSDLWTPGNVYAGIDARANQVINAHRWLPAPLLYRVAPIRAILGWHPPTYRIRIENASTSSKPPSCGGVPTCITAHTVVAANSGVYGHGLRIVPSAQVDDGTMHVLTVGDCPRREVVRFLLEARSGAHVRRPEVSVQTATKLTLAADREVPLCADGDQIGWLPTTISLHPAALEMVVP